MRGWIWIRASSSRLAATATSSHHSTLQLVGNRPSKGNEFDQGTPPSPPQMAEARLRAASGHEQGNRFFCVGGGRQSPPCQPLSRDAENVSAWRHCLRRVSLIS